jgi:hypothetical protein
LICLPLSTDFTELARGAKGLIRMEGSQTIIEPPQIDDTHTSSRSAGKKPQIFSFGELPSTEELADQQTSHIGPLESEMSQITRHRRLCMMIWGSNFWIIVLRDSILVSLLVSFQSRVSSNEADSQMVRLAGEFLDTFAEA